MARNSYVDERLFGCAAPRSPKACSSPKASAGASPAKAASPCAAAKGGAVLLSKAHLDRMMQVRGEEGLGQGPKRTGPKRTRLHPPCLARYPPQPAPAPARPPQKSPVLTPEEQEAARRAAEARLEQELAAAKAARAAREAAAAEAEARRVQPKTEMELLRERERREVISKAQLALLVRGRGQAGTGTWYCQLSHQGRVKWLGLHFRSQPQLHQSLLQPQCRSLPPCHPCHPRRRRRTRSSA